MLCCTVLELGSLSSFVWMKTLVSVLHCVETLSLRPLLFWVSSVWRIGLYVFYSGLCLPLCGDAGLCQ